MSRWHNTEWDMLPEHAFRPRVGGGMTLEGGKGGSAPTPDPNIGIAQRELSALAKQQWETFTTQIYPDLQKAQAKQDARLDDQIAKANEVQDFNLGQARDAYSRYQQGAIPAMEAIKKDADEYNQPEYQERLAQGAVSDINSAFDQQRQAAAMRQQQYGIDPTSGVAQGMQRSTDVQQALMAGAAANQVRQAAKEIGLSKQANVYNMYAGLPAQGNANTGLALNAGAQGVQAGQMGISNIQGMGQSLGQAASTAMGGWNQVGQLGVGKYNADVNAYQAKTQAEGAMWGGLGSALGSAAALYKLGK